MKGKEEEALNIMRKTSGEEHAMPELEAIKLSLVSGSNKKKVQLKEEFLILL